MRNETGKRRARTKPTSAENHWLDLAHVETAAEKRVELQREQRWPNAETGPFDPWLGRAIHPTASSNGTLT